MKLHIFNPEHDIALAANLENFTAPHAGRQLRHDLGFLPLLWAGAGDYVIVDDVEVARKAAVRLQQRESALLSQGKSRGFQGQIATLKEVVGKAVDGIEPWGWDAALRAYLLRKGVGEQLLPTPGQIASTRALSHRRVAASLLPHLRVDGTTGEAFECQSAIEVGRLLERYGHLVLKAPWSSSGRGLRFLETSRPYLHDGWLKNVMAAQGSVMAEPYYHKVKDFGMEFHSDGQGGIDYLGLSLFHTQNGAYTGNILATEHRKREMISNYLPASLLETIQVLVCQRLGQVMAHRYEGPFGIDMMVVGTGSDHFLLHPCVEINLRRTMGHVALSLAPRVNPAEDDEVVRVMRIVYEDNQYKLKIQRL